MLLQRTFAQLAWATSACFFLAGCALTSTQSYADTPRITAEHYYQLTQMSDLTLSNNGELLAFTQTHVSEDRRGRERSIYLLRAGETTPIQFTQGKSDSAPLFSPNGEQLLFLGSRNDESGLYVMSTHGGEPRLHTQLQQGSIRDLVWHPNGQFIYLTISHEPEVTDPWQKKEEDKTPKADVDVIEFARYKRQGGYLSPSKTTLWRMNADGSEPIRLLTDFTFDINGITISPNGKSLAFTTNQHPEAENGAFASDLFVLTNEQDLRAVEHSAVYLSQPVFIDNYNLAYTSRTNAYAAPALERINLHSQAQQVLSAAMDYPPQQLWVWQNALWFTTDYHGSRPLMRMTLDGKTTEVVQGEGYSTSNWAVSQNGDRLAWVRENETTAPELVVAANPKQGAPLVYAPNNEWVQPLELDAYQRFTTLTADQHELEVFVLLPKGTSSSNKVPVVLNIKGGPGGMWGHQWFMENQLYAARGYAVVFVNYRGSTGFGYAHQNAVRFDYGGVDYRDNIAALDAALARFAGLDADRQFITGGSHGGFLTNWATTQTQRFKAAVTQRSVSNWISEAGTQAFPPISMREEFGGSIWENYDYYWNRSPLKYANQVTSPTLIIHSTDDHITPIGQGEEWFYALHANNVPVEMVVFRGEGHGLSRNGRPVNLVERLNRIVDWFDAH
ncbi:S9 family peptidase [Aliidiomarina celeris]|uniref:S9 family peptidase n=1 Tax=Aliidiomarina celeris TaxID=2249428 RepID=UPI000DEBCCA6|nr:S9 family peptidase [Aliidiomarina celeris]